MTSTLPLFEVHSDGGNQPTPWLVDHLRATGALTETGLSRRARPRRCYRCRAWTVTGLDADVLALEAACDPTPLSALGEVLALATGRRTVDLVATRGRLELEQRWADHIAAFPPGSGHGDVLAEHRCGLPVPDSWAAPSTHPPPRRAAAVPTDPPF